MTTERTRNSTRPIPAPPLAPPLAPALDRLLAATAGLAATIADTEAILQRRAEILSEPTIVKGRPGARPFDLVSLSDAAERTGRHPEVLRRWCAEGRIDAVRIGRSWWLRRETVANLAQHAQRARPRLVAQPVVRRA